MAGGRGQVTLEASSRGVVDALESAQQDIAWAADIVKIFQSIEHVHAAFSDVADVPESMWALLDKTKELERYVIIDLQRHLATGNGRPPYYLSTMQNLLGTTLTMLHENTTQTNGIRQFTGKQGAVIKDCDHLGAEIQAMFLEYGFCQSFEALTDIGEISRRLSTINERMENTEQTLLKAGDGGAAGVHAIIDLHEGLAQQHGIQQAATYDNITKVTALYDKLTCTLTRLENNICTNNIAEDSQVFNTYIQNQRELKNTSTRSLYQYDATETINGIKIHPGTRAWLLEIVNKWFHNTKKSIFFLSGKRGTGKTALAAQICKLYGSDVVGSYFFDSSLGNSGPHNHVDSMLQALAADMCRTLPEYAQHLEEKFNRQNIREQLTGQWQETYRKLIKEPLNALYSCREKRKSRRKVLLIDAVDECNQSDWSNLTTFFNLFMHDLPSCIGLVLTVRARHMAATMPADEDLVESARLEDRACMNRHIKDIEIYMSSSMGAILSGEDEAAAPSRAKADEYTLQNTMDELLKNSAGRFDYAIEVMESFAKEMGRSQGQFLSSVKKSINPIRKAYSTEFDNRTAEFASPFRSYRDREGRSVTVRVMRQSLYPMDKTRVALIRGRHKELHS